jgi:hypothetical protein
MTQITYPQSPAPTYSSDLTAFLAASDYANARANLGLGSAAESDAGSFAASSHGHASSEISDFSAAVAAEINSFVGGAPEVLDSWAELVAAIQNDQSGLASLTNVVAGKLPISGGTMAGSIDLNENNINNISTSSGWTGTSLDMESASFSGSAAWSFSNAKLENVANGTLATDAVNYGQVGSAIGNALKIVDVGGSPGLPAIDGSQLTNLPGGNPFDQNLNTTDSPRFAMELIVGAGKIRDYGFGQIGIGGANGNLIYVSQAGLALSKPIIFNSNFGIPGDVSFVRSAPGVLDQRSGTNPQTHRIFGTYTSGSGTNTSNDINGEWLSVGYNGTEFEISPRKGSSGGSSRSLVIELLQSGSHFFAVKSHTGAELLKVLGNGSVSIGGPNASLSMSRLTIENDIVFNSLSHRIVYESGRIKLSSVNEIQITGSDGLEVTTSGIGLFGQSAVTTQPAAIADATDAASTQTALNELLTSLRSYGIIAT